MSHASLSSAGAAAMLVMLVCGSANAQSAYPGDAHAFWRLSDANQSGRANILRGDGKMTRSNRQTAPELHSIRRHSRLLDYGGAGTASRESGELIGR